jgi:hypothetical protein
METTEEVKVKATAKPETKETVVEEVETEIEELSPAEQEASEFGWVPKEKWESDGRDPDEWRSAREFVERGKLFKSMYELKRGYAGLDAKHKALQQHHTHVFEKAHKQALDDLKKERRMAMRNDDMESAEALENEIEQLKENHEKERQIVQNEQVKASTSATPNPEFQAWMDRNAWYLSDADLRDEADAIALMYVNRNPQSQPGVILKHVESTLRKRNPDKFGVRRAAPNAVASVDRTSNRSNRAVDTLELDDVEQKIMRSLIESGEMTEKEYKVELRKAKGMK